MKLNIDWQKQIGDWYNRKEVKEFLDSPYMIKLMLNIIRESKKTTIYPERSDVFKAFRLTSPGNTRVIILGQDPYHDGSATGLAFANPFDKLKMSPSLRHIWGAIERSTDSIAIDFDPTLESWAEQGVLLLNTALTVEKSKAGSHAEMWKEFTEFMVKFIAREIPSTIFLLWGKHAQNYIEMEDFNLRKHAHVLEHEHPMASGYRGEKWDCKHFKRVNEIIEGMNGKGFDIKW